LQEQLHALDAIAGQFDRDIDFFVWEMRPIALDDLGLVVALDNYVKHWSRQIGVEAEFHSAGVDRNRLPIEIETVLSRDPGGAQ
jgi:signal transduction histidine kinase